MSNLNETTETPDNKDNDEVVIEKVIKEEGSDRPKEIIARKGGIQCTITPRPVVKLDEEDLKDFKQEAATRSVNINEAEKDGKEENKNEEAPENQPSTVRSIYNAVTGTAVSAFQSVKGWISSFF